MKYADLKNLPQNEINKKIRETKEKMFESKMKNSMGQMTNSMGQMTNPVSIRNMRRDVARLKTALTAVKGKGAQ
jgi:large subunit ribosomal protein L29